jgi:hypothetical protein
MSFLICLRRTRANHKINKGHKSPREQTCNCGKIFPGVAKLHKHASETKASQICKTAKPAEEYQKLRQELNQELGLKGKSHTQQTEQPGGEDERTGQQDPHEREQALRAREQSLDQQEQDSQARQQRLHEREQALRARERNLHEQEEALLAMQTLQPQHEFQPRNNLVSTIPAGKRTRFHLTTGKVF